jgi:hypothetical protein
MGVQLPPIRSPPKRGEFPTLKPIVLQHVALFAEDPISETWVEAKVQAETAARFPCPKSFRLYLSEVRCEPSLLACLLDALYAAAASCPAQWHERLNFFIAGNSESAATGPLRCYAAGVGCNF